MFSLILAFSFAATVLLCATPASYQFVVDGAGTAPQPETAAFAQPDGAILSPTTDQIQTGGLGVRILFAGKNSDGKILTISSKLQNVTEEPIFIALVGPPPAAIDTQGVTYELQQPFYRSGTLLTNANISNCFKSQSNYLPAVAFSALQPGASAIVATTFGAEQASTSGFLSVTMNIALGMGKRPSDSRADDVQLENLAISFLLIALEGNK